jgi:hypothetical protein
MPEGVKTSESDVRVSRDWADMRLSIGIDTLIEIGEKRVMIVHFQYGKFDSHFAFSVAQANRCLRPRHRDGACRVRGPIWTPIWRRRSGEPSFCGSARTIRLVTKARAVKFAAPPSFALGQREFRKTMGKLTTSK